MKLESRRPTAIILAAGCASRFDGIKQLARLEGKPALQHVVDTAREVDRPLDVMVVLGCSADEIRSEVDFSDCRVVVNEDWKEGMSTSVKLGVEEAPADATGYVLLLADMPLITPKHIELVLDRTSPDNTIVATSYEGTRGFPVYFDGRFREELLTKPTGDVGARIVINDHPDELTLIETDDEAVVFDIDDRGDLGELMG